MLGCLVIFLLADGMFARRLVAGNDLDIEEEVWITQVKRIKARSHIVSLRFYRNANPPYSSGIKYFGADGGDS